MYAIMIMTTTDPLECAEMMQELQESLMMTMLSHGKNITSFSLSAPDYDEIYGMVSSMIHKNNDGEDEGVESDDDDDDGSEVTLSRNNEDDDEDEGN